ncbi:MAG TPA: glycosyltransferase [Ohtaekwangia sp.]|nr:glycosyltransferase [Ohtaekwangia sp.]
MQLVLAIIFFSAIAVQIIYFIVFLIGLNRKKSLRQNTHTLPVSVIVCAHDEEDNLRELIPLLLRQDYPNFEVVIIDDRSNDNTFDFLLDEAKKDHRLRMVHVNRTPPHVNSKKYSLTLGIKAAKYEWLLLTDADCRPESEKWISSMSNGFAEDKTFVLGFSPYVRTGGFLNLFIRFESLITAVLYMAFGLLKNPYMGVGRNLAYRKSFFLAEKGFNQFMKVTGGDDDLFVNQHATGKNTEVIMGKDSVMYSIPEKSWRSFFRQKLRHLSVGKFYKFKHRFLLGTFMLTWLIAWALGIYLSISSGIYYYYFTGAIALRLMLFFFTLRTGFRNLEQKFEWWTIPFLDFLYMIYYLTTGLFTLGAKKVRWKN